MTTRTLVAAAIGAAAVVAAGAGSFLALRMNSAERAGTAEPVSVAQAPIPPAVIGTSVAVEPAPVSPPAPPAAVAAPRTEAREARPGSPAPVEAAPPRRPATPPTPAPVPAPATSPVPEVTPQAAPVTVPGAPLPEISVPVPPPTPEPVAPPPPPKPRFEEVTVREDAVIGIRLETAVSSDTARVEDRVTARVSRDVTADSRTAIPAGSTLEGTVVFVERGGKFKERARIGIRFTTLVLADNTRLPIQTDTIFRDGQAPGPEATSKIGAATVVGTILGAVIGGKKGAAIGGAAGAAGGTATVAAGGRNDATMSAGSQLTVRLAAPLTVLVERQQN